MGLIYGYTRVSTFEQAQAHRSSLSNQKQEIERVAANNNFMVANIFEDAGVSGSIALSDRPSGKQLHGIARSGDTIIVSKLDRIFRSVSDASRAIEQFDKRGVALIICEFGDKPLTNGSTARFQFNMMAGFAQFERDRIQERTFEGRQFKKASGGHIGGSAPYGHIIVGSGVDAVLEDNPDEQKIISRFVALSRDEKLTIREIARRVAAEGITNRLGKPMHFQQVARILKRAGENS